MSPQTSRAAPMRRALPILVGAFLALPLLTAPPLLAQGSSAPAAGAGPSNTPAPTAAAPPTQPSAAPPSTGLPSAGDDASFQTPSEQPDFFTDTGAGVQGLSGGRPLPPNAFGQNPPGIPYSSIINPTGGNINDINLHPFDTDYLNQPKFGEVEGSLMATPGNGGLFLPFVQRGTAPANANIKAGPFYVQFHSIDGLVLYDDNYNLSRTDRHAETLILLRLNLSIIAQITQELQFVLTGDIAYLPLTNQFGLQTDVSSALGLLSSGPLLAAQLVYDTIIAGWPVRFADDFTAGAVLYSDDARDNFDLFQGDYLARQENGRYTFHQGNTRLRDGEFQYDDNTNSLIYFSNNISALTERVLPSDVRLTVRIDHQDFWYNQNSRGLPDSRDDLYASAIYERPNLRFKPYVSYEATYVEGISGINQSVAAGIFGPIDDQIFLRAQLGYYDSALGHQGVTFLFSLNHDAGPYTSEQLTLERGLDYFDDQVRTSEYYRIQQIFGPKLIGQFFVAHNQYQDLINDGSGSVTEYLAGVQFLWTLGPRTNLQLASIVERQEYSHGVRLDTLTARAILNRSITDTLSLQILYQYQRQIAGGFSGGYYNNIIYLRLIKLLD